MFVLLLLHKPRSLSGVGGVSCVVSVLDPPGNLHLFIGEVARWDEPLVSNGMPMVMFQEVANH